MNISPWKMYGEWLTQTWRQQQDLFSVLETYGYVVIYAEFIPQDLGVDYSGKLTRVIMCATWRWLIKIIRKTCTSKFM